MNIEVWSDVVCPWCYIGRRRLKDALSTRTDVHALEIHHRAFQLQPDAPPDVVIPTTEYLAAKYGISAEQSKAMQENVTAVARSLGLEFHLDRTLTGNTADAHRLLLWAGESGGQESLLEQMYAAYFTQGRSLFNHSTLLELVSETGLNPSAAQQVLESTDFDDEVRQDAARARDMGATGVPFFVFDMTYGIAGAQPLEVFTQTLDAAVAQQQRSG